MMEGLDVLVELLNNDSNQSITEKSTNESSKDDVIVIQHEKVIECVKSLEKKNRL